MNNVLVIGGSGVLGSAVVRTLKTENVNFCIGSRQPVKKDSYSVVNHSAGVPWTRVDLTTGEGLSEALAGVDTVFHLASATTKIGNEPFEVVTTRNLLRALKQSNAKHLIYSSIVGVDKIRYSYYEAKFAAETLIQQSGLPYSILRATQFHNLIDFLLHKLLYLPIGFVPKQLLFQPIHVTAVADALYRLAQAGPQQTVQNLGGPQRYDLGTMAQRWMQYRPVSKPVVSIPTVGPLMKSFARGENTCSEKATGSPNWEAYLQEAIH